MGGEKSGPGGCDPLTDQNEGRLKSRHIQFIALGGTIGTGLFLGIGKAFTTAGPLSLLMGYTFTGVAIFAMVRGSSTGPVKRSRRRADQDG